MNERFGVVKLQSMRRGRHSLVAALALALVLAVVGSASARPAVHYISLKQGGVSAKRAVVVGRTLTLKLKLKQRVSLRFAIVSGKDQIAWNGPGHLNPGTYTLHKRLHGNPAGKHLRLRVTARRGPVRARGFIRVRVLRPNRPPTGLALSNASVTENQPAGTAVGTLSATDPDRGDRFTYRLVAGNGGADNARFAVTGNALRTAAVFDFEQRSV